MGGTINFGVVMSQGSTLWRWIVRLGNGAEITTWDHGMKDRSAIARNSGDSINVMCAVSDKLEGRRARKKYREGLEEVHKSATGKHLSISFPEVGAAFDAFVTDGADLPGFTLRTPIGQIFVSGICRDDPSSNQYFSDLPDRMASG